MPAEKKTVCNMSMLIAFNFYSPTLEGNTTSLMFLGDYTKIENSLCVSGQGYTTLNDAKLACSSNQECIGVLDEKCGSSSNSYYLCSDDLEMGMPMESCVHKKHGSTGMNQPSPSV